MGSQVTESLPERRFGWLDMWAPEDEDPRTDGGWENSEKGVLLGQLTDRRLTLRMKCQGLDASEMATPSVPPSDLTLLGLVRHLASVEHYWVRTVIEGREQSPLFVDAGGNDVALAVRGDATMVEHAWEAWEAEVENTDRVVGGIDDLGALAPGRTTPIREIVVHLIREYAQHLGHADLLRERIDGRIGQ